jgi:hypothetical protein
LADRVDTESLFREINEVFKRYGVVKGMGFVPDRLEISFERATSNVCALIYREFFTYLPTDVMALATSNAVNFLSNLGVPKEKITTLEKGVEVRLEGDARITYFPILEMLIQDRNIFSNLDSVIDSLKGSIGSLMGLFDFSWGWDTKAEERWSSSLAKIDEIIESNPGMQSEIEEIVKRHSVCKVDHQSL